MKCLELMLLRRYRQTLQQRLDCVYGVEEGAVVWKGDWLNVPTELRLASR